MSGNTAVAASSRAQPRCCCSCNSGAAATRGIAATRGLLQLGDCCNSWFAATQGCCSSGLLQLGGCCNSGVLQLRVAATRDCCSSGLLRGSAAGQVVALSAARGQRCLRRSTACPPSSRLCLSLFAHPQPEMPLKGTEGLGQEGASASPWDDARCPPAGRGVEFRRE